MDYISQFFEEDFSVVMWINEDVFQMVLDKLVLSLVANMGTGPKISVFPYIYYIIYNT
jgi:ABC-type phosphate/phosphonate transport system permease subunit